MFVGSDFGGEGLILSVLRLKWVCFFLFGG